ncbi:ICMT-domain-containing protein [Artomyces pyxidatus]|uniref:ICMT-domain-containing protein n=1 Tax=Artomyces pyxidatus TaxID=48021 RepID=A0ACB8T301_9AGAM|nr:ICMT-domain-containing protein [Artomyces pyxidatus]
MATPLLMIPLLLTTATFVWRALIPPPEAPPSLKDKVQPKLGGSEQYIGRFTPLLAILYRYQFAITCLVEMAVILANYLPKLSISHQVIAILAPGGRPSPIVRMTPHFAAGVAIAIFGSELRLECYRVLGEHFTYRLFLRDEHRLIKKGPYAYVRHPSYTGLLLMYVGCALILFGRGSWLREGGWLGKPFGKTYVALWLLMRTIETTNVFVRTVYEDQFLKEKFGTEWVSWAMSTRYRILPYVF